MNNELTEQERKNERQTANEYRIYITSYKRTRRRSKAPVELEFTEVFSTNKTETAYDVYLALCTLNSLKQDSSQVVILRLERSGLVVKELRA